MAVKTCPICGKEFKQLAVHMRRIHPQSGVSVKVGENSSSAPPSVRFVSSRSSGLTVVIRPKRRGFVNTSGGSIETVVDEGKKVTFVQGELKTSDPEIIDYLTNTYKDARFPITRVD